MLKFGIHDFINAQPIIASLKAMNDWVKLDIYIGSPAQLADKLNDGGLDFAMIPAIEYLRQAESLRLFPGISIASKNKVGTVLLISKYPLSALKSMAVDNRSRTSVGLLKLLFKDELSPDLKWVECSPDPDKMLQEYDAALLIGDPALGFKKEGAIIYDLSEEWFQRTGKPFVHAVIAARAEAQIDERMVEIFRVAKQEGLMKIATIARTLARQTGLPETTLLDYLQNKIRYNLGAEELDGLSLFQSLCVSAGLIQKKFPFDFAYKEETV